MIEQIEYYYSIELQKGMAKKLDLGSNFHPKILEIA